MKKDISYAMPCFAQHNNVNIKLFIFIDIACRSSPCLNGGECIEGVVGYFCECASGFTGVNCETSKYIRTMAIKM